MGVLDNNAGSLAAFFLYCCTELRIEIFYGLDLLSAQNMQVIIDFLISCKKVLEMILGTF